MLLKMLKTLQIEKLSKPQFKLIISNRLLEFLKLLLQFLVLAKLSPNKKLPKALQHLNSLTLLKPKHKLRSKSKVPQNDIISYEAHKLL